MRPYQRHRRTTWAAAKQLPVGNIIGIPYLFRQQSTFAGTAFDRRAQPLGLNHVSGRDRIMRALARKQRPRPAMPSAVEWSPVVMLAVTIIVVTAPDGTL